MTHFIRPAGLLFVCLSQLLFNRALFSEQRPNVLFIAVDDLRVELGCYGDSPVLSPNIDRLADRGMLFQRAYCQQAVCNPSRASLLTGRRPDSLRIWNLSTHFRDNFPNIVTLPQHFKNNGYHTRNIGKIFHNWRTKIKGDPVSWSTPAVMHFASHYSDQPQVGGQLAANSLNTPKCESRDVPDDAYFDGRVAEIAIQSLRELKDQPFFLAVGFWKPHLPFNAPTKYWELYDRKLLMLAKNRSKPKNAPDIAFHDSREMLRSFSTPPSEEQMIDLRHGYYAATSFVDAQIGKVLNELDRLHLSQNTIVVFWSDHGFHLGEHDLWCKTSNFELDARVPLIIAPPNFSHGGQKSNSLVELLDLFPTLVDMCKLPQLEGLEGVSLRPVLIDPRTKVKTAAYTQHPRPAYYTNRPDVMGYSVRTERFRYTEWRKFEDQKMVAQEFYDHVHDSAESENMVDSINPQKLREAAKLIEKRLK